jgi:hypothetical protein
VFQQLIDGAGPAQTPPGGLTAPAG